MASLDTIFNHLVLPSRLPAQQDTDLEVIEENVLNRLIHASETVENLTGQEFATTWTSLRYSLQIGLGLKLGHLDKASLLEAFSGLKDNNLLILHIEEQNAGLLLRCNVNSNGEKLVTLEVFEASPSSEAVLATEGALLWEFPGRAVEVPIEEFVKASDSLATFLDQANREALADVLARSHKANISVVETRDTTDPALIVQMLLPLFEAVGSAADIDRFRKRIRDDVNIDNGKSPWRRLPLWLVLRVAIQRQLSLTHGDVTGRACYKFLISTMLAQFLQECAGRLAPELTMLLKAKLCRRLAKLENERVGCKTTCNVYESMFDTLGQYLESIIVNVTREMETKWTTFKEAATKSVPLLPQRADNAATCLSLPNGGKYLDDLLARSRVPHGYTPPQRLPSTEDELVTKKNHFATKAFKLVVLEIKIETEEKSIPESKTACRVRCVQLAEAIGGYLTFVRTEFNTINPEQMSLAILSLFDLWILLDQCAIKASPEALLTKYHPIFHPELLDSLQLPRLSQMRRLRHIQEYLRDRSENCHYPEQTILSEPGENCFAVRYVKDCQESSSAASMRQLLEDILDASKSFRERKSSEYERLRREYDNLSSKIASLTCVCTKNANGSRNVNGCTRCWHWRCQKKLKIGVHEDFLPKSDIHQASVVFELEIPEYLAAYRNATWMIFKELAHPSKPISKPPVMLLKDYSQLKRYMSSEVQGVSMASSKKSFRQTHFKESPITVPLSEVLHPLALDFNYYDAEGGIWLKDLDKQLTFQHLCGIHIPRSLRDSIFPKSEHPSVSENGPSSYEVVANETKCPPKISVHEFASFQRLLSGNSRRWFTMLTELASSNINFSSEDSMCVFTQLATQAGPAGPGDILGDVHAVFRDRDQFFCRRLSEQISHRLHIIESNWRETHCMEMLITLSLRLSALSSGSAHQSAQDLLLFARKATFQWFTRLRDEVRNATEAEAADRAAIYGFGAALLCRRTFSTFEGTSNAITAENLNILVQASVALQQNLVIDISKLPTYLQNMLVRDMKLAFLIEHLVKESIQSHPDILGNAINETWSDSDNCTGREYSPWEFISSPLYCVESKISTTGSVSTQTVRYNYVEGHLLLDGKPLGRLPSDIRESEDVQELFENQHLLTFPSPLPGMSHVLATRIFGNEIHFGTRQGSVIIRARTSDGTLEYIPRSIFMGSGSSYDLPTGLLDSCVHWLNLDTKQLAIRRKPSIWKTRPSDWRLDVARRFAQRKTVLLVDPHSNVSKKLTGIFYPFEAPARID